MINNNTITTTFTTSKVDQILFPVQRVVLKAMYGIPLDDNPNNRFEVTNWDGSVRAEYTEAEYLRGIHRHGRSSISEVTPGKEYKNVWLAAGRRSGKGLLTSAIVRYEAARRSPYTVSNVAVVSPTWSMMEDTRAGIVRDVVKDHDEGRFTETHAQQNWRRIEVSTSGHTSRIHFLSTKKENLALSMLQVGAVILDDFDYFEHRFTNTKGTKLIALSTPNNPENSSGDFYRCFQSGLMYGYDDTLSLQIPTWEMNPLVPFSAYKAEKERDEFMFLREFGAQFRPKKTTILVVLPSQQ